MDRALRDEFDAAGRVWFRNAVSSDDLSLLDQAMAAATKAGQRLGRSKALNMALSPQRSILKSIGKLDPKALPVRIVAFNKSEKANWGVPWHQERVIAVAKQADVTGY